MYASRAIARFAALTSAAPAVLRERLGRCALELDEELDRLVEVVRADLEELVAGPLGEPLGEARVVLGARELREAACTRPRG